MTSTLGLEPRETTRHPPTWDTGGPEPRRVRARWGLLRDLEHPGQARGHITPNWYASIMGTGIVAVAAASLPERFPGLRVAAVGVWALAATLLVGLTVVTALHWAYHPTTARSYANDPVMMHFYGAVPMAILTVGAGALLLGRDVVGPRAAVDLDWALWSLGTVAGLACAVAVPYRMFTRGDVRLDGAFGGWLMPVVPPMVSASTGALLIPYAAAGQPRLSLVLGCYALFGLSLLPSLAIIMLIWWRLVVHGVGATRMVPTLWIVLGPLGQSITAVNLLGAAAHTALPGPYAGVLAAVGIVYGVPVWGFAMLWAVLAGALTIRAARDHLPFSLTWWSFTFPVGTMVTGTTGIALHTGSLALRVAAAGLFAALVTAWLMVAARTVAGSLRGRLFLPAPEPLSRDSLGVR
jgi:C4-dicarboxylate transporter/malic acid transport protein